MSSKPLIENVASIIQQGSDDHKATAEKVIDAIHAATNGVFIPSTGKWLEQVRAGKEFRLR